MKIRAKISLLILTVLILAPFNFVFAQEEKNEINDLGSFKYAQDSIKQKATTSALQDKVSLYASNMNYQFNQLKNIKPSPDEFAKLLIKNSDQQNVDEFETKFGIFDGAWRTNVSYYNLIHGDEDVPGVILYSTHDLSNKAKKMMLELHQNLKTYALATQNHFLNRYITLEIGVDSIYEKDWMLEVEHDADFKSSIWYNIADPKHNPTRDSKWTPVYYDSILKHWMVSLITPIYDQNEFLGITGGDMTLDNIYDLIKTNTYENRGYSFLFDVDKNILVHPNYLKQIEKKGEMEELLTFKEINEKGLSGAIDNVKGNEGTVKFIDNGIEYTFIYEKLDAIDWYYGFVIENSFIEEEKDLAIEDSIQKTVLLNIKKSKEQFYDLQEKDTDLLKSLLTDFMEKDEYKQVFLEGDREKLFEYSQELFNKNKEESDITHFYYHRPDGTNFVRVHNANVFDDEIKRITFKKSKESDSWGTGIELGKTAFALRVVHPYYYEDELIGYVEFGQEIDHFIQELKRQSGSEYGVVVKNEYIDKENWASVRREKGLRNNYDDISDYVLIDSTDESKLIFNEANFDQVNFDDVSDEGNVFHEYKIGDKTYVDGGFALFDAGGNKVGAVVLAYDVSKFFDTQKETSPLIYLATFLLVIFIVISALLLRIKFFRAENVLKVRTFSIRKKLIAGFGILILLLVVTILITYNLSQNIAEDTHYIQNINSPLELMSEQVIGYDAILTGNAHAALLHVIEGEMENYEEDKMRYNEAGLLMDKLLKEDAPGLLEKSRRSDEQKTKVYGYLEDLDKVNLKLVDLEMRAFEFMDAGNYIEASKLIIGEEYEVLKEELANLYDKWAATELEVTEEVRARILDNSRKVQIYNLFLGIIFVLFAIVISLYFANSITKPIRQLFIVTEKLRKGNFEEKVDIKTGDELEILGDNFNLMAEEIVKSKVNLEKRVAERTAQLEKTNKFMTGRELKMIELKKALRQAQDKK